MLIYIVKINMLNFFVFNNKSVYFFGKKKKKNLLVRPKKKICVSAFIAEKNRVSR